MSRRKVRFGRFLPTVAAEPFLSNMPAELRWVADSYKLTPTTRPYLTKRGSISVRLVFRGREERETSMVVTWILSGQLSDDLYSVLDCAIGSGMRLNAMRGPNPSSNDYGADAR